MPRPKPARLALGLAAAAAVGGCGGAKYAGAPGPAPPVVLGAAITPGGVSLDRSHLGAGVVRLVVTNLTGSSQQVVLQSAGGGFQQQTAPINPADTGELKAQLPTGTYTVGVKAVGVKAALLAIGAPRIVSRDKLLLP